MTRVEEVVLKERPDLVLVYGDVNSTVAAALVCSKLGIRVGHVEAGLRSFDRTMPEEINRLVTDQISDLLFTPSEDGNLNLEREGVAKEKIFLVGNAMIDTLLRLLALANAPEIPGLNGSYALVTLHRPSLMWISRKCWSSFLRRFQTLRKTSPSSSPSTPAPASASSPLTSIVCLLLSVF
jgi:UDP-N-acetylglucosamine 2-epimerase (non-hydrolysing)